MNKIYIMDAGVLSDDRLYEYTLSGLSEYRRERVENFKQRSVKNQRLAAGVLLSRLLGELGICEKHIRYETGENGKPYLPDYPELHISLSHSGSLAVACAGDMRVGCDIQKIGTLKTAVAERFFCKSEYMRILSAPPCLAAQEFFRLWTFKESYIKLLGKGLSMPLNSFEIDFGDKITVAESSEAGKCFFREYSYAPGFCIAQCCEGQEPCAEIKEINI